jgi:hypothetical protein
VHRCRFKNVVRRAEQGPLGGDFLLCSQKKLPEAAGLFDQPKNRFHHLFP